MRPRIDATARAYPEADRLGFGSILGWSCCLGVGSGAVELVVFLLKCRYLDPRNANASRQMVWMFPASGLIVVGGAGLILAAASRALPRLLTPRFVVFVLSGIAFVGVWFRAPIYTLVCLLLATMMAWSTSSFLVRSSSRRDLWTTLRLLIPLGSLGLVILANFGLESWRDHRGNSRVAVPSVGSSSNSKPKNVILMVLDTVRAESLGLYGYARDTSPNLASLASRGILFDRAFSTAPWTAPSHASLFTGRWPHELSIGWDRPLDRSYPTLAEVLASRGYATAGFVANTTYCSYETGLDRGFDHYEDYDVTIRGVLLCSSLVERTLNFAHKHPALARWLGDDGRSSGDRKDAARINRDFLGWLDGRGRDSSPFFAFLNFYDAHHPYLSPDPGSGAAFGRKPGSAREFRLLKTWWERDKQGIKPDDVELARDSYDRCIAYLDGQLGLLFGDLDRRGILENSVVIVTADHGEHLGERRLFGHGCSVYRPELHVPLLIVAPGVVPEGRRIERPVSLRDVPSTVLDAIGAAGASPFPGRSLARTWDGKEGLDGLSDVVLSEIEAPPDDDPNGGLSPAARGPMRSAVDVDFHYIRGGDGREELYDLRRDPAELTDLASKPRSAATLERFRASVRK